jgi:TRAP-type C4-dicarboxylate transport system permease small subunit
MWTVLKIIDAIRKVLDKIVPFLGGLFVLLGVLSAAYGFLVRLFEIRFVSASWTEEVTIMLIIWGMFLMMGSGFRNDTQTRVTLLEDHLSKKKKLLLHILIEGAGVVLFAIILIGGLKLALQNYNMRSAVLLIRMTYPYLSIPISSFIVLIELIMMLIVTIFRLVRPEQMAIYDEKHKKNDADETQIYDIS